MSGVFGAINSLFTTSYKQRMIETCISLSTFCFGIKEVSAVVLLQNHPSGLWGNDRQHNMGDLGACYLILYETGRGGGRYEGFRKPILHIPEDLRVTISFITPSAPSDNPILYFSCEASARMAACLRNWLAVLETLGLSSPEAHCQTLVDVETNLKGKLQKGERMGEREKEGIVNGQGGVSICCLMGS